MRILIVAAVAAMGMAGIAVADEAKGPVMLTDAQMDNITAGVGLDNIAIGAWFPALFDAGFVPRNLVAAEQGVVDHAGFTKVTVPRRP